MKKLRKFPPLVIAAIFLAGCAYKGSEQERQHKIELQVGSMQLFLNYLDPDQGKKLAAAIKADDPKILSQLPFEVDRNAPDPTRIDLTAFRPDVYTSGIIPMASEKAVFFGSIAADPRIVAMVFAINPKAADPIAPWAKARPLNDETTLLRDWAETRHGVVYNFSHYRRKDVGYCASVQAGTDLGNLLAFVCATRESISPAELTNIARTASVEGRVPAAKN
ncbi:hypothetical protein ACFSM5_18160 [Lacibacterium aquatile]|uniref:Uncharacterized protein n=1 Tax=Lacibacterium aquatile TaxID=1168082 RepID=A0ABW5DWH6_9PROT